MKHHLKQTTAVFTGLLLGLTGFSNVFAADEGNTNTDTPSVKLASSAVSGWAKYGGVEYNSCSGSADVSKTGALSAKVTVNMTCNEAQTQQPNKFTVVLNVSASLDRKWLQITGPSSIEDSKHGNVGINQNAWLAVDDAANAHHLSTDSGYTVTTQKGDRLECKFDF